jgi:hypothetical protein
MYKYVYVCRFFGERRTGAWRSERPGARAAHNAAVMGWGRFSSGSLPALAMTSTD